jgi:hypothetical protein
MRAISGMVFLLMDRLFSFAKRPTMLPPVQAWPIAAPPIR